MVRKAAAAAADVGQPATRRTTRKPAPNPETAETETTKPKAPATKTKKPQAAAAVKKVAARAPKAAPKKAAPKKTAPKKAAPASKARKAQAPAATKTASEKKAPTTTAAKATEAPSRKRRATSPAPAAAKRARTAPSKPKAAAKRASAATTAAPRGQPVLPTIVTQANETPLEIFAIGEGEMGELGLGPTTQVAKRPRKNPTLEAAEVVDVALGGMHGLALTRAGRVWSWGVNDLGALGRDTAWDDAPLRDAQDESEEDSDEEVRMNPRESTPGLVDLPEGVVIARIAAGDSVSVAVTQTGLVYGWGTIRCADGPVGFSPDSSEPQPRPYLIPELTSIVSVCIGRDHVLCLRSDGRVLSWGNGEQYQLGRRVVSRTRTNALLAREFGLPRSIPAVHIATGSYHSFAVLSDGRVFAWGLNAFGQCGTWNSPADADRDDARFVRKPTIVTALAGYKITKMAAGLHHSVALTDDGRLLAWGRLDSGEVGINPADLDPAVVARDFSGRPRTLIKPTLVSEALRFLTVACGTEHNLAIGKEDAAVWTWGYNGRHQCGQGPSDDDVKVPTEIAHASVQDYEVRLVACGGNFSVIGCVPRPKTDAPMDAPAAGPADVPADAPTEV